MFGCHNCGYKPEKNVDYEKSPCAVCRTAADPSLQAYQPLDQSVLREMQVMHPAYEGPDEMTRDFRLYQKVVSALSQTIMVLLDMKEHNPETFRVVSAKMNQPTCSYAQLAAQLSCKKQNILYHLRKAVQHCPELSFALIIDSRFSHGKIAVSRWSEMCSRLLQEEEF